ncbi:hypothetical protein L195_g047501 [Trifolium pratense]|uniref:Uncharacterized protein n=1 Tax=Trifolium pratense TaxID=57577 RepID=A0A2K3MKL9_TRIPR|nr:hypothetical protein L195_g047501 [Trifolium pratense]
MAPRGGYTCAVAQASGAMAQLPVARTFPIHSSCAMRSFSAPWRSSQSPNLPFLALIAPCAAPLRHGAEPREKLFLFNLNCAMRSSSGAMAQNTETILDNSFPNAPCAVQWRHGAAYRGLSSPILLNCAMRNGAILLRHGAAQNSNFPCFACAALYLRFGSFFTHCRKDVVPTCLNPQARPFPPKSYRLCGGGEGSSRRILTSNSWIFVRGVRRWWWLTMETVPDDVWCCSERVVGERELVGRRE